MSLWLVFSHQAFASPAVTLNSDTTGVWPVMGANVFARGEFAAGSNLLTNDPNLMVEVKRRWNDGSPKHAIFSGRATLTAGTPRTITFSAGTPAAGTPLSHADIIAAAPQSVVTLTGITQTVGAAAPVALADITVSLADALATAPVRTWLANSQMVECHWLVKPRADLWVWFQVRHFAGGHTWVRTVVEYTTLPFTSATYLTYQPTHTVGGVSVWNNGGSSYRHGLGTRWSAEGWAAGGANVTVRHDPSALRDSKLVPNYMMRHPTETQLASLAQTYTPGSIVNLRSDYPGTGYHRQIGLLPEWDMLYAVTGDPRAWRSVQANSHAAGTHATIWRDPTTRLAPRPSDWPNWTLAGANQGGYGQIGTVSQTVGTSYVWDTAHNTSSGYFAYLITGDYLHLETLHTQCATAYLFNSSSNGSGTNRISYGQTRSQAWVLRTAGQLAGIAPTGDTVADDYRTLAYNNALFFKTSSVDQFPSALGYPVTIGTYNPNGPLEVAPWMHHFWIMSAGHVSDLEAFSGSQQTNFNAFRDWMYQGIVGNLGDGSTGTYDYRYAGRYTYIISSVVKPNYALTYPGEMYSDWSQVWNANLNAINATADANGFPRPANATTPTLYGSSFSYYINLLPAIAYAVDHDAPGAAEAWNRLTGATNWSRLDHAVASQAVWSIAPRAQPTLLQTAEAMPADTWHDIAGTNINQMETSGPGGAATGILESAGNYPATNWGGKIWWDAARRRIGAVGTAQGFSSETPAGTHSKAFYFDNDTHSFSVRWNPAGKNEGHFYDNNCSFVFNGKTYRRAFASPVISEYDAATETWSDSPYTLTGISGGTDGVSAIEIHPTLGAQGSLLALVNTQLVRWDFATGARTLVGTYSGITPFYGLMHYVPGWNRVVFGGGNAVGAKWYSIDAAGNVADTGWTSPTKLHCGGDIGVFLPDPAGRAMSWWLDHATRRIYSINWSDNTWTPYSEVPRFSTAWVGASIAGHGVLAFWEGRGRESGRTQSRMVLYKVTTIVPPGDAIISITVE